MISAQIETLHQAVSLVDHAGVGVFAVTGALVAARKGMDPIGFIIVGTVTGIGGGTLRDLMLGARPVNWVGDDTNLAICIICSLLTFWLARQLHSRYRALLWLDAVGMALFSVAGTQKALAFDAPALVAVTMGTMSACFGGLLRDTLCGERPLLFHKEIYATAAILGSAAYVVLAEAPIPSESRAATAFLVAFAMRAAAIRWNWSLPHYKQADRLQD